MFPGLSHGFLMFQIGDDVIKKANAEFTDWLREALYIPGRLGLLVG